MFGLSLPCSSTSLWAFIFCLEQKELWCVRLSDSFTPCVCVHLFAWPCLSIEAVLRYVLFVHPCVLVGFYVCETVWIVQV